MFAAEGFIFHKTHYLSPMLRLHSLKIAGGCACLNSGFGNDKLVQMRVTLDLWPRKWRANKSGL